MLENRFSPLPCRHLSFTLCLFLHGSNSKRWDPDAGNGCWRDPILPTDPRVYSAAHKKLETIFHTIGILMTCLNTSISPSLIKTEISRGTINRHTFLFVHEETKHGRVKKISCNLKNINKTKQFLQLCYKMGSQWKNAGLPDWYNEKILPSRGSHNFKNIYLNLLN